MKGARTRRFSLSTGIDIGRVSRYYVLQNNAFKPRTRTHSVRDESTAFVCRSGMKSARIHLSHRGNYIPKDNFGFNMGLCDSTHLGVGKCLLPSYARYEPQLGQIKKESKNIMNEVAKNELANMFLNLDNTNFSSLEVFSILSTHYKPDQNQIISTKSFSGDRHIENVFTKLKVVVEQAKFPDIGRDCDFIFNGERIVISCNELIAFIQKGDNYDSDSSRAKEFLDYSCIIIGSMKRVLDFENLITKVEYTKTNNYFKLESYFYYKPHDDVMYNEIHIDKKKYEGIIEGLHPKIDTRDLIESYLKSNENILILFGDPGTGKTTLIKQMMLQLVEAIGENPIIVYSKDPDVLKKEVFWNMILEREPHMLILDDLDTELSPREVGDDNSVINKLLSVSDGIFHSKTKIVITTNMNHDTIDPAIIRPGRCFDILNVPGLTREEAMSIWTNTLNHTENEFNDAFAGVEIIKQALLMSEHEKLLCASKTYLKDDAISVRDKYIGRKKRSIGFI